MTTQTGLLLLTSPVEVLSKRVSSILRFIGQKVTRVLYVHFHPNLEECLSSGSGPLMSTSCVPLSFGALQFAKSIYAESSKIEHFPDTRVLLRNISEQQSSIHNVPLMHTVEEIYTDSPLPSGDITAYLKNWIDFSSEPVLHQLPKDLLPSSVTSGEVVQGDALSGKPAFSGKVLEEYSHVVLGGTFDRLHVGHKVLLTESAMRATSKVTVGITDGVMNKKKTLPELIQPCKVRIQAVYDFLRDVKPQVAHRDVIVPIVDPFGPSIVEADMGAIIVSQETRKGGIAVNKKRLEKGLCELDIHEIEIIADEHHTSQEEDKISSSSQRMRLLGSLLHPPTPKPTLPSAPYVIGLTGGIASGKSSVCKRLERLGAVVIDCDKLGHQAYLPGALAYNKVVKEFGQDVVSEDGHINRKALGAKVFADRSRLKILNQIVWPEIARMAQECIAEHGKEGKKVCVLDAAILLEAEWDSFTHEVWSCIIPKSEALQRIMDRDNLSQERATQRIESQMSNEDRIQQSSVVFSTFWEPEYTQKQVERAWMELMDRVSPHQPAAQL